MFLFCFVCCFFFFGFFYLLPNGVARTIIIIIIFLQNGEEKKRKKKARLTLNKFPLHGARRKRSWPEVSVHSLPSHKLYMYSLLWDMSAGESRMLSIMGRA